MSGSRLSLDGLAEWIEWQTALIKLDMPAIVKTGAHPLVPFLPQLQMQRLRPQR
jgi:hypothetical protein